MFGNYVDPQQYQTDNENFKKKYPYDAFKQTFEQSLFSVEYELLRAEGVDVEGALAQAMAHFEKAESLLEETVREAYTRKFNRYREELGRG